MTKDEKYNIKLDKVDDKTAYENLLVKYAELENKIADIKANCDLAIEGRDIKIKELELELTVQKDQLQEETNLHLHAEDYIKSLEQQIEKMKCCGNCRFSESDTLNGTFCHREGCFVVASAKCKLWEM